MAKSFCKPYYDLPHRVDSYHSWQHIISGKQVFSNFFEKTLRREDILSFYMAWYFHDSIYLPTSNDNEALSCKLFNLFHKKYKSILQDVNQEIIINLIMSTKTHKSHDELSAILIDTDLSYLGSEWLTFVSCRKKVRNEYFMYNDEEYRKGSILFCNQFLEKNEIFQTKIGKIAFEKEAKENLLIYKRNLENKKIIF